MTLPKTYQQDESGLIIDLDGARRNRENIKQMRLNEHDKKSRWDDLNKKGVNMSEKRVKNTENVSVPPKPDIAKMNTRQRNEALRSYYESNKDRIIADLGKLDEKATLKKWKISVAGWLVMRARWMPDKYQYPSWYKKPKGNRKVKQPVPAPTAVPQANHPLKTDAPIAVPPAPLEESRVFLPFSELLDRLTAMSEAIVQLDAAVSEILNRGYMDEELKICIIAAFIKSSGTWEEQAQAKKITANRRGYRRTMTPGR